MNAELLTAFVLMTLVLVLTPGPIVTLVIATGATLGVRAALTTVAGTMLGNAFLLAAIAFDLERLPSKFGKMFPVLLLLDLLWALSPLLLVDYVSIGLALGMTAALIYLPFAQRSLVLMYAQGR